MDSEIIIKLTEVDSRSKSNTHRIEKLEEQQEALTSIATSVAVMANEQKTMTRKMNDIDFKVGKLEQVPKNRWNKVVDILIAALMGGAITFLFTRILGG